jgi:hypothetical protein
MAFDLTNLTGALTALGSLVGLANNASSVEFNQKLIEVQQCLIGTQIDFLRLIEENSKLKAELQKEQSYDFHHSVSWKKQTDGAEEGPYCPICLAGKIEMRLESKGRHATNDKLWIFSCPVRHVKPGEGRNAHYHLPKDLLKENLYGERA